MDLRLRGLTHLDPLAAPLPSGTEVSTREMLLAIKRGDWPLERTLAVAEAMTPDLEDAREATRLPRHPDVPRADALLRRVREEVARRHLSGAPGPLGCGAPPAPDVVWDAGDAGGGP